METKPLNKELFDEALHSDKQLALLFRMYNKKIMTISELAWVFVSQQKDIIQAKEMVEKYIITLLCLSDYNDLWMNINLLIEICKIEEKRHSLE